MHEPQNHTTLYDILAALMGSLSHVLMSSETNYRKLAFIIIGGASSAIFVVPAILDYYHVSSVQIATGAGYSGGMLGSIFARIIATVVEKKGEGWIYKLFNIK